VQVIKIFVVKIVGVVVAVALHNLQFINNAKKCAKSINKVQSFYVF